VSQRRISKVGGMEHLGKPKFSKENMTPWKNIGMSYWKNNLKAGKYSCFPEESSSKL
jgi:hypothetical protein